MKFFFNSTIFLWKTCLLTILFSCFIGLSTELKPADLKQQAFVLYYSNQYSAAAAMAEKAVETACKNFYPTNSLLADYYNFFGFLSVKADKFRDAEYAFRVALSIRQNNFGSNSLEVAESLNNLAEALKYLSKFNESEQCHSNAFAVRKKLLPLGHKLILESLNNLGEICRIQAKFLAAENYFDEGINAFKKNGSNTNMLSTLVYNRSNLLRVQGKYDEAADDAKQNLVLTIKLFGTNHSYTAAAFNDFGILLCDEGKYSEAEKFYFKSIEIYTNLFSQPTRFLAKTQKNLAQLYKIIGMYSKAEKFYMTALDTISKIYGDDHIESASIFNELASLYQLQEKFNEAETLFSTALSIREQKFGNLHNLTAQSRNNLAKLYKSQKRYLEAEQLYLKALDYAEPTLGTNHPNVATYMNNLAEIYSIQKKYSQATKLYLKSLAISKKLFGNNHPDVATTLNLLGKMYIAMLDFNRAEKVLLQALKTRQSLLGKDHPKTAETEFELGKLFAKKLDFITAIKYFEKGLNSFEKSSLLAGGEPYSAKVRTQQSDICSDYLRTLILFKKENHNLDKNIYSKTLWATELAKSRQFLDQLLSTSAARFSDFSEKDKNKVKKIQRQLNALDILSRKWKGKSSEVIARLELKKGKLRAKLIKLYELFKQKYPRYMELRQLDIINVEEVQNNLLNDNEMMISYWIGESNLFTTVICKQFFEFYAHPISSKKLSSFVKKFKKNLELQDNKLPSKLAAFKKSSYNLYKEIFKPFEKEVFRKKPETLFVVPHGVLSTIPFEALTTTKTGNSFSDLDYLFNQITIAYVPSAMTLRAIRKDKDLRQKIDKVRNPILLFGNPAYSLNQAKAEGKVRGIKKEFTLNKGVLRSKKIEKNIEATTRSLNFSIGDLEKLEPLPGTKKEAKIIENIFYPQPFFKSIFSSRKVEHTRLGLDASEEYLNLLNKNGKIKNYKYIHFAAHGLLPGQFPNLTEAAIVLSLFGDNFNDGFLTMSDIFELKLNSDIVTLSACQSGLITDLTCNHGISDLSRAFFYAGTPRVVATLWSISDASTAKLMKEFYGQLKNNKSKGSTVEALNLSKIKMKKSRNFSHPFYWAGFVLFGEK